MKKIPNSKVHQKLRTETKKNTACFFASKLLLFATSLTDILKMGVNSVILTKDLIADPSSVQDACHILT